MLYVLTLGWEWFAAAAALGLLVGFATSTRGGAGFSDRWAILVAVALLGGVGASALAGLSPGRGDLLLEISFLGGLAYFIGLPIGGGAKGLLPAPAASTKAKPRPLIAPAAPREKKVDAPAASQAPRQPAQAAASAAPQPAPGQKNYPGRRPESLAAPRGSGPDDLTKIKGIGPKSVEKLHGLGVFHFDQIAAWNLENARWIGAALSIPGRVERGKWIQQARDLAPQDGERASP